METTRQQKIARQIQKDIADIFQKEGAALVRGLLVTVTAVRVSPDFSYAKIYISVFPFEKSRELMERLDHENWFVRRALGQRIRNQLKNVPELQFFLDDSLEYIEHIEEALKHCPPPLRREPPPAPRPSARGGERGTRRRHAAAALSGAHAAAHGTPRDTLAAEGPDTHRTATA